MLSQLEDWKVQKLKPQFGHSKVEDQDFDDRQGSYLLQAANLMVKLVLEEKSEIMTIITIITIRNLIQEKIQLCFRISFEILNGF